MKTKKSGIGISICLRAQTNLVINGIRMTVEEIHFDEKMVHLDDTGELIRVLIDENEVSKMNFFTEIKKQDIYSIYEKGNQIYNQKKEELTAV